MTMDWLPIDMVWRGALAIIPLAVVVAAIGRLVPCQPSTRHAMWLIVLALLVVTPFLPRLDFGQLSAGPSADLVPAPRTELAPRREWELRAPTASPGPPAAAFSTTLAEPSGLKWLQLTPRAQRDAGADKPPLPQPWGLEKPTPAIYPQRDARAGKPPVPPGQPLTQAKSRVDLWLVKLDAIRASVVSLPPIPPAMWLGGR